ncbi:Abi family protein [Rugamonas sp.]|uniref:Abi family protein n=1 Tax=Rugamonas sp. TaxID=1926287 RepID=UPI0025E86A7E|nr:Abi family protein [Rugamonas sp.]
MAYCKPWKDEHQQIDMLESRGLLIGDRDKAIACLARIGYYRLSGYWFAFRERTGECCDYPPKAKKREQVNRVVLDTFKDGASFHNAVDLYVFDKQLRLLAMDALERIEIAMRVDISHRLGNYDRFAYLHADLFHSTFTEKIDVKTGTSQHHQWIGNHARLVSRSKEEFVIHNKSKYGLPLAIWIACEVWDFGTMSKLFGGMQEKDQDSIAKKYGISNGRIFAGWLRSLNYFRNVCAHHCRLWNRNIVEQPKLPPQEEIPWIQHFHGHTHRQARCYMLFVMAGHMLGTINPHSRWKLRVKNHLASFPDLRHLGLSLGGMGAVDGWDAFE